MANQPTPDWLTNVENVQVMLGLVNQPPDPLLPLLISEISALMIESMNRSHILVSSGVNPVTDFLSSTGDEMLVLRQWPVRQLLYTGTCVQGSTSVSNVSSTQGLFVGQSVLGYYQSVGSLAAIQASTTIASISGTTVTLSLPALSSGTFSLVFGVAVYANEFGWWGATPTSFPGPPLQYGTDYALRVDQPNGLDSKSAMLGRLNQYWWPRWRREIGGLAVYNAGGFGNIMAQYNCGYYTVPPDLEMACLRVIAKAKNSRQYGMPVTSASYEDYSISFQAAKSSWLGLLDGEAGAVLARYRIMPVGTFE